MKRVSYHIVGLIILGILSGCMGAAQHSKAVESQGNEFTLGHVQKEIRIGMSQADVAARLGSPNIVTKDASQKETWIYDKIGTEVTHSQDRGGVWLIFVGYEQQSGAVRSNQKTLTVVIKFDESGNVESVNYHSSKF